MMDAGNSAQRADVGLHFERGGVPLSALEMQKTYRDGQVQDVQVCFTPRKLSEQIAHLCRAAPATRDTMPERPDRVALAELKNWPVCQLPNYRRYAVPMRNDDLSSPLP